MIEPWFSADTAPLLALLSLFALLEYLKPWAEQGRHRTVVMGAYAGTVVFGGVLLAAGVAAWLMAQPPWVWSSLTLAGALLAGLVAHAARKMHHLYEQAELRRSIASDL